MIPALHKLSAILAILIIAALWVATAVSEIFLTHSVVIAVKSGVPYGVALLIPVMATAGATGLRLAKGRRGRVLGAKVRRMPIVAANGVLILIPAAFYLAAKAQAGSFDATFYAVQALELAAGAANLTLLALNIRDGRRMTAGRRRV